VDVLSDVFRSMQLTAETDFCTAFNGPWGMDIHASSKGYFHAVLEGECWLYAASEDKLLKLEKGDIVALPTGGAHWVSHHPDCARVNADIVVDAVRRGENIFPHTESKGIQSSDAFGAKITHGVNLLCGSFLYDTKFKHPFLVDLPCLIHVQAKYTKDGLWLSAFLDHLAEETRQANPGGDIIVSHLSEVLFVYLLRQHLVQSDSDLTYLRALNHPQIGKSLNLIHDENERLWTIEALANEVGLSRSAFSERFTELVDVSPKQYITRWRMQRAKRLLQETRESMLSIAHSTGYASEASFSKAFKAFFAITPGALRA